MPPSAPIARPTHEANKPSISSTMHWLSRTSLQTSKPTSKPRIISEPTLDRGPDGPFHRSGILGTGATVVRTPDEALRDSRVRNETDDTLSPLNSPPLPPLPPDEEFEEYELPSHHPSSSSLLSSRPLPAVGHKLSSSPAGQSLPIPTESILLSQVTLPKFHPVLISDIPIPSIERAQIVVNIETSTKSYKTSFETLMSRPSNISEYLTKILPRPRAESLASSVYSTASDDVATFRRHLTTQGLLPQKSNSAEVHVFLDRPSEPYAHILAYLRSPTDILPRAVFMISDNELLDLRDEAEYLALVDLYKLCLDEAGRRTSPARYPVHTRGMSFQSISASIHSSPYEHHPDRTDKSEEARVRSPPTPQSWRRSGSRSRSRPRNTAPPAGWI